MGKPSGYDALAQGVVWQQRVTDRWRELGFQVRSYWGHNEPDLVVDLECIGEALELFPNGYPKVIVSVKTFYLVPSSERRGPDGRLSYASARTVSRKDVQAELGYAQSNYVLDREGKYLFGPLFLTIVNTRNETVEHVSLNPWTFQGYTTSQRLNLDDWEKELSVIDIFDPRTLEENQSQGWRRVENPQYDPQVDSFVLVTH